MADIPPAGQSSSALRVGDGSASADEVKSERASGNRRRETSNDLPVIVDFSIVPIGVGTSLSPYVKEAVKYLHQECKELKTMTHPNGTCIEGPWDEVMAAVKECHKILLGMGVQRIITSLKIGIRTDKDTSMAHKMKTVESVTHQTKI